jgi:hypothetical protein
LYVNVADNMPPRTRGQSDTAPLSPQLKQALFHIIANAAPKFLTVLNDYQSNDKWLAISSWLDRLRSLPGASAYVFLYEDESRILNEMADLAVKTSDEMSVLEDIDPKVPSKDAIALLNQFGTPEGIDQRLANLLFPSNAETIKARVDALGLLTDEEKRELEKAVASFGSAILALFHQVLSVAVHGAKMTSLVQKALTGDDDAFLKAIHIDRGLLTAHPKFAERYQSAIREGGSKLGRKIAYRLTSSPTKGRTKLPLMFAVVAMLDSVGWLSTLTHAEILDVYSQAGGDGGDESTVAKALRQYRRYQNTGGMSMH